MEEIKAPVPPKKDKGTKKKKATGRVETRPDAPASQSVVGNEAGVRA